MQKYNPQKIEKKWQKYWEHKKLFATKNVVARKKNVMLLTEFAYPSGNLHIGHWYAFALPDIKARYLRMKGYNVLYPTGFDAFGLPAENAAIKHDIHPEKWTRQNIAYMTRQLKSMGAMFDWSRKVSTIDPDYYRWTQWMFIKFCQAGLAYRATTKVNWCPKDKTVLANEQVVGGKCDRCQSEVMQKGLAQWMFKSTECKVELIDGLDALDWQESAKLGQKNWVGRSEGAIIKFSIFNFQFSKYIETFTTRSDTVFGVTALVVSPELAQTWVSAGWQAGDHTQDYIKRSLAKRELERQEAKEKTGVDAGIFAANPANNEKIPVWVGDYVLGSYGTGAVMFVPAHDKRDFEFAKKYQLPIKEVIIPKVVDQHDPPRADKKTIERNAIQAIVINSKDKKVLCLKWKKFPWTTFITGGVEEGEDGMLAAKREILEESGYKNVRYIKTLGGPVQSHFYANHKDENRNALFTCLVFELENEDRQEISADEKEKHEPVWLSWQELQKDKNIKCSEYEIWLDRFFNEAHAFESEGVLIHSGKFNGMDSMIAKKKIVEELKLKGMADFKKTYRLRDWILSRQRYWGVPIPMVHCVTCGYQPVNEKELPVELPPLKDFKPTDGGKSPLTKAEKWLKTTCPTCKGAAERETDTMDTFVDSSWYFMRYTDPTNKKIFASKEKIKKWLPVFSYLGGAEHTTMHLLYSRFFTKALKRLGYIDFDEPFLNRRNRGIILGSDNQKMSKSRGNVIDPDSEVKKYGADAVRMYLAFMGPYLQGGSWNPGGITGVYRFLNRVWNFVGRYSPKTKKNIAAAGIINKYIKANDKGIGFDISDLNFNTGVSDLMKLLNELEGHEISKSQYEDFLKLLAPFAPHITEELWRNVLKNKTSIHLQPWPVYNQKLLPSQNVVLVIQINGKMRDKIEVVHGIDQKEVEEMVLRGEKIKPWVAGKEVKKIIFVPDKLINIVL